MAVCREGGRSYGAIFFVFRMYVGYWGDTGDVEKFVGRGVCWVLVW